MNNDRVRLLLELDSITKELKDGVLLSVVKFAEAALDKQQGKRQQRSAAKADKRPYKAFKVGELEP